MDNASCWISEATAAGQFERRYRAQTSEHGGFLVGQFEFGVVPIQFSPIPLLVMSIASERHVMRRRSLEAFKGLCVKRSRSVVNRVGLDKIKCPIRMLQDL